MQEMILEFANGHLWFNIGLEDADDLINDIKQALAAAGF